MNNAKISVNYKNNEKSITTYCDEYVDRNGVIQFHQNDINNYNVDMDAECGYDINDLYYDCEISKIEMGLSDADIKMSNYNSTKNRPISIYKDCVI